MTFHYIYTPPQTINKTKFKKFPQRISRRLSDNSLNESILNKTKEDYETEIVAFREKKNDPQAKTKKKEK